MSPTLAATLTRAADVAGGAGAPEVTLEHVLLALCDDVEAVAVLDASRVAIDQLYSEVVGYLNQTHVPDQAAGSPKASADVSRIIEAAAAAARGGRQRDITGAIVLAAIVGDGRSVAAQILQALGLTFDEAIKALQRALNQPGVRDTPIELPPADDVLARARERVQLRSAPTLREIMNEPLQRSVSPPMRQLAPPSAPEILANNPIPAPHKDAPVGVGADELNLPTVDTSDRATEGFMSDREQYIPTIDASADNFSTQSSVHLPTSLDVAADHSHRSEVASLDALGNNENGSISGSNLSGSDQAFDDIGRSARSPAEVANSPFHQEQAVAPLEYGDHQPAFPLPISPPNSDVRQASVHAPHFDAVTDPGSERIAVSDGPYGVRFEPTFDIPRPVPVQPPPIPATARPSQTGRLPGSFMSGQHTAIPPLNAPHHPGFESAPNPPPYPGFPGALIGAPDPFPPRPSQAEFSGAGALPFPQALSPDARYTNSEGASTPGALMPANSDVAYPNLDAPMSADRRQNSAGSVAPQRQRSTEKSIKRVVTSETGQLAENIPRAMRIAKTERVEIRIAKSDVLSMLGGLDGGGQVYAHGISVTPAMSVRLRAPDGGFFIETASPETQWIDNRSGLSTDDFASWRFLVTPNERGWSQLQIVVSARTMGADGIAADTELPEQILDVKVRTNLKQSFSRLVGWTIAALVGGVLARFGEASFDTAQLIFQRVSN
jgi:hypothetical protein